MSRFWPLHVALAATYPFVNHISMVYGVPAFGLLWLGMVLACGVLVGTRSLVILYLALLCLGGALILYHYEDLALLSRMPPMVIALSLAWVFGRTLLHGRVALITQIAIRMHSSLPAATTRYCYWLTWVWTIFLTLLGVECALLAIFASPYWWSLITNFINYALIALLFIIEIPIRRLILVDQDHLPFITSLRNSIRLCHF